MKVTPYNIKGCALEIDDSARRYTPKHKRVPFCTKKISIFFKEVKRTSISVLIETGKGER